MWKRLKKNRSIVTIQCWPIHIRCYRCGNNVQYLIFKIQQIVIVLTNGGKRLVWLLVSHNTHTHKSTIEMECIITLLALTLLTTKLSNSLHKHNGPSTTMSIQPVMCHFDGLSSRLILICLITLITITIRFIRNLCSYISYRSFLYSFFFIMSSLCSK